LQALPAIVSACLTSPRLGRLMLNSPLAALWDTPSVAINTAQLGPLAALRQLPWLELAGVDRLGASLAGTLRQMTELTHLRLAIERDRHEDGSAQCKVLDAIAALTQLVELNIDGSSRSWVLRLPDAMSSLTRLRILAITNVRVMRTCRVLATLAALQQLKILRNRTLRSHEEPQPQNPLPPGMHALRSLRSVSVTCSYQPMPVLALPALTMLRLDEPSFGGEVWLVLPHQLVCCVLRLTLAAVLLRSVCIVSHTTSPQCLIQCPQALGPASRLMHSAMG